MQQLQDYLMQPNCDPLVDRWPRYFGFVNDVGEATKSFLPRWAYIGSYVITGAYGIASVENIRERTKLYQPEKVKRKTIDASMWHLFATFLLTPCLIHYSKAATARVIANTSLSSSMKTRTIPAAVGLCLIPLLVPPVDNTMHFVLNKTYRLPDEQVPYEWHGIYSKM